MEGRSCYFIVLVCMGGNRAEATNYLPWAQHIKVALYCFSTPHTTTLSCPLQLVTMSANIGNSSALGSQKLASFTGIKLQSAILELLAAQCVWQYAVAFILTVVVWDQGGGPDFQNLTNRLSNYHDQSCISNERVPLLVLPSKFLLPAHSSKPFTPSSSATLNSGQAAH